MYYWLCLLWVFMILSLKRCLKSYGRRVFMNCLWSQFLRSMRDFSMWWNTCNACDCIYLNYSSVHFNWFFPFTMYFEGKLHVMTIRRCSITNSYKNITMQIPRIYFSWSFFLFFFFFFLQARPLLKDWKCQSLIDGRMINSHDCHQLYWMSRLVGNCLQRDPQKRLNMNTVSLH